MEIFTHFSSAMIFISVLSGAMDFGDIVILCSRPNSCCQQNPKCFDMPLFPLVCFPERVIMTVKQVYICSSSLSLA